VEAEKPQDDAHALMKSAISAQEDEEETDNEFGSEAKPMSKCDRYFPNFFIQETGEFRKYWEILVICLALYNALVIPIQIFFQPNPVWVSTDAIRCTDAVVDLLFLIDIIFEFRTTYLEPKLGVEVREPGLIAKRYIQGRFFIDFISSVPFNALFEANTVFLDLLGLLKLLRVTRIGKTIRGSNVP